MDCPKCGAELRERLTSKQIAFLVCTRWPECKVSGTPELLERFQGKLAPRGPVKLGSFIVPLANLRILQSQLKQAQTDGERESVREQARNLLRES